jgi:hypothetical protein
VVKILTMPMMKRIKEILTVMMVMVRVMAM